MTKMETKWSERAKILDENDDLKHLRECFSIPLARDTCDNSKVQDDRKCIYFNGNSLGCMVNNGSKLGHIGENSTKRLTLLLDLVT